MAQVGGAQVDNVPFTRADKLMQMPGYAQAALANEHALFAPQGANEEDRAAALAFAENVRADVDKNASALQRFKYKWVDCMY